MTDLWPVFLAVLAGCVTAWKIWEHSPWYRSVSQCPICEAKHAVRKEPD